MKVVWLIVTLLVLLLVFFSFKPETGFSLVVATLIIILLVGLVLNFLQATVGTMWKNIGWGMFYGTLLFVVLYLAFFLYVWFLAPLPLPNTG